MEFSHTNLQPYVQAGLLTAGRHPTLPLTIYNYTNKCAWDRAWDEATLTCRGLILDDDNQIVARPFRKFFNLGEMGLAGAPAMPGGEPVVTEKCDGSLGIIYYDGNGYSVATRGSFASDQAVWATGWLKARAFSQPSHITTLAEIIYPANRIVVDYNGREGLCLIGAIDNRTGADISLYDIDWWGEDECPPKYWDGWRAMEYQFGDMDKIGAFVNSSSMAGNEGVVLCWSNEGAPSTRIKLKAAEYVRLHRILTNTSSRSIWEMLRDGTDFDEYIQAVPDEFFQFVSTWRDRLNSQYDEIVAEAATFYNDLDLSLSRKELAAQVVLHRHSGIIFRMLDGKDFTESVWRLLRPDHVLPFASDIDL